MAAVFVFIAGGPAFAQSFTHPSSSPFPTLLSGSTAWADYDLDGNMDALITGLLSTNTSSASTALYHNTGNNQFAVVSNTGLTNLSRGGAAWADMNNDDWPDLALSGQTITQNGPTTTYTSVTQVYKNNGNGTFTAVGSFTGLSHGSVTWCDYNNDGFKDLLVCGSVQNNGSGQTLLYKNNKNNTFSLVTSGLPGLSNGECRWGDYDNDGLPDVLVTGGQYINNNSNPSPFTALYRNVGDGTFTDAGAGFIALNSSSGDFGDYDNDGRLDVVLIGQDVNRITYTKVYHNEGNGVFADVSSGLSGGYNGKVRWGDFNQDGFADFMMASATNGMIYNYAGSDAFTRSSYIFNAGSGCDLNLTDITGDGLLDFAVSGVYGQNYYSNNSTTTNTAPSAPTGVQSHAASDKVLLTWAAPADDFTAANGLTYNLMIGTNGGNTNILSPEANTVTGKRYVTGPGNAGNQNWQWLDLPAGTYYWKVQAVDASYANSGYSTQGTLTLPGSSLVVHIESPDVVNVCNGGSTVLTAVSYPQASAYQWYKNGSAISAATGASYTVTATGQYNVQARTSGSYVSSTNTITVNSSVALGMPTTGDGYGCSGQTITLTANAGSNATSVRWYTTSGSLISTNSSIQVNPGVTTSYKVVSYDAASQCASNAATATAVVSPAPQPPTGISPQYSCGNGDTVTIAVNPVSSPYIIYWFSSASGGQSITGGNIFTIYNVNGQATYYASTFNSSNGCSSVSRLPVTAMVESPPAPPVVPSVHPCTPGTVTLRVNQPMSSLDYLWYSTPEGGTPFFTGASYTFSLTETAAFFVSASDGTHTCESSRAMAFASVMAITDPPYAENVTGYGTCKVSLYAATPQNATTCRWYGDPNKNVVYYTGNNYLTNTLSTTTEYWVAGYNEENQCSGPVREVSAIIQPAPSLAVNPDQIYPVPNNPLTEEYNDVNLFTGDVNLTLPLITISGAKLSYSLNAFYNSRSAVITPYYTANTLGGLGWKLLDYPKIVYDQTQNKYFFLDGLGSYPLDTVSSNTSAMTLACPGRYYSLVFTLNNLPATMTSRSWTIDNGAGEIFEFNSTPIHWGNSSQGYLWSLSRMTDAEYTDTLTFSYNNSGWLTQVSNIYDERITLSYSNNRLSSLTHYILSNANFAYNVPGDKLQFVYQNNLFEPSTASYILTEIKTFHNISCSTCNQDNYYQSAPSTKFEYNAPGNAGALKTIISPSGSKRSYSYLPLVKNNHAYRPVGGIFTDAGHLVHYEGNDIDVTMPEAVGYKGVTLSSDLMYLQSNQTTVTPGENTLTALFDDESTSFEKGSNDDVFKNIDKDDLYKDYALTGTHSLKFDGTFNLRATSKQFPLDHSLRRVSGFEATLSNPVSETGSLDSLTLAFYCLQTHQTLDVDFYLDFNFYDSHKNKIDNAGCHDQNYELQNQQYGQWVPFELRFAVPSNAAYFDFEFRGGSKLWGYDFYMDDVSISGTENNIQGEMQ